MAHTLTGQRLSRSIMGPGGRRSGPRPLTSTARGGAGQTSQERNPISSYAGPVAQIMTEAAPAPTDDVAVDPDGGSTRPPWLRWLWLLLPWIWFVVRGFHQVFELVAILLPVLVVSGALAALLMAAWRRDLVFLGLFGSLQAMQQGQRLQRGHQVHDRVNKVRPRCIDRGASVQAGVVRAPC